MAASQRFSDTFPNGFSGLPPDVASRRRNAGGYILQPERLPLFNQALQRISPQAPPLGIDQIASAARRVFERYRNGEETAFVNSRMRSYERLQQLASDADWQASDAVREQVTVLRNYRANPEDLLPDHLPTIGLLDDALLIDIALQGLRDEVADYEEFCHFRQIAADFAGVPVDETGLGREQWREALQQAQSEHSTWEHPPEPSFVPASPRSSLFHIV